MKKLLSHLLEPRSIILGVTVFYFVCSSVMWSHERLWAYHREMFVASVLLFSAVALVINKVWSNLIAAVVGGQLPFLFIAEFWMLSMNGEVPLLSFEHIKIWVEVLSRGGVTIMLWLTLSSVILSFSVVSILRRSTALPAADDLIGIHPFEKNLDRLPL